MGKKELSFEESLQKLNLTRAAGGADAVIAFIRQQSELEPVETRFRDYLTHLISLISTHKIFSTADDVRSNRFATEKIVREAFCGHLSEASLQILLQELCHSLKGIMSLPKKDNKTTREIKQSTLCLLHCITSVLTRLRSAGCDPETAPLLEALLLSDRPAVRLATANAFREYAMCTQAGTAQDASSLAARFLGGLMHADSALVQSNKQERQARVDEVHGYAYALAAVLGAMPFVPFSIKRQMPRDTMSVARILVKPHSTLDTQSDVIRCEAGWAIVASLVGLGKEWALEWLADVEAMMQQELGRKASEAFNADDSHMHEHLRRRLAAHSGMLSLLSLPRAVPDLIAQSRLKRLAAFVGNTLTICSASAGVQNAAVRETLHRLRSMVYETTTVIPDLLAHRIPAVLLACITDIVEVGPSTLLVPKILTADAGEWELNEQPAPPEQPWRDERSRVAQPALDIYDVTEAPANVLVVNSAIPLFAAYFIRADEKVQRKALLQLKAYREERGKKPNVKLNIAVTLLCTLRTSVQSRIVLSDKLISVFLAMCLDLFGDTLMLRRVAAEGIGFLSNAANPVLTGDIFKALVELMQRESSELVHASTVYAIACMHRCLPEARSLALLQQTIEICHALQQSPSSIVQGWNLHSLQVVMEVRTVDCAMFAGSIFKLLSLLKLHPEVVSRLPLRVLLGQAAVSLVNVYGPELRGEEKLVKTFKRWQEEMAKSGSDELYLQALILQQTMALFAPNIWNSTQLLSAATDCLLSSYSPLRPAAVHAIRSAIESNPDNITSSEESLRKLVERLFEALDMETVTTSITAMQELLFRLVEVSANICPFLWLDLCKKILTVTTNTAAVKREDDQFGGVSAIKPSSGGKKPVADDEDDMNDVISGAMEDTEDLKDVGDDSDQRIRVEVVSQVNVFVPKRWLTRARAVECIRKLVSYLKTNQLHVVLSLARKQKQGEYLINRLPDLVSFAFNAASVAVSSVRAAGLNMLVDLIKIYGTSPDPDYEGHYLLEMQMAPISSAIRASLTDVSPLIIPLGCETALALLSFRPLRDDSVMKRVVELLSAGLTAEMKEEATAVTGMAKLHALARLYIASSEDKRLYAAIAPVLEMAAGLWIPLLRDCLVIGSQSADIVMATPPVALGRPVSHAVSSSASSVVLSLIQAVVQYLSDKATDEHCRLLVAGTAAMIYRLTDTAAQKQCFQILASLASWKSFNPDVITEDVVCDLISLQRKYPPSRAACEFDLSFCKHSLPLYVPSDGIVSTPAILLQLLELVTETVHRFLRGEYSKTISADELNGAVNTLLPALARVMQCAPAPSVLPFLAHAAHAILSVIYKDDAATSDVALNSLSEVFELRWENKEDFNSRKDFTEIVLSTLGSILSWEMTLSAATLARAASALLSSLRSVAAPNAYYTALLKTLSGFSTQCSVATASAIVHHLHKMVTVTPMGVYCPVGTIELPVMTILRDALPMVVLWVSRFAKDAKCTAGLTESLQLLEKSLALLSESRRTELVPSVLVAIGLALSSSKLHPAITAPATTLLQSLQKQYESLFPSVVDTLPESVRSFVQSALQSSATEKVSPAPSRGFGMQPKFGVPTGKGSIKLSMDFSALSKKLGSDGK